MYLRHSTVTKNGKTHTYWRLVRAVRVGRKVRQVTVAQLGELDAKGRIAARHLADSIVGVDRQPGLFDEEHPTEPVTVDPGRLRLERGRRFGDVWLAWKLWQALGLDRWLEERLPRGREDVAWGVMAAVLVIARLCGPSGELHLAEHWDRRAPPRGSPGFASHRASCTSPSTGIGGPHSRICSACPRPRSTTIDSIARSTACCPTRTRWKGTSRSASEVCSSWNMTSCCTT